MLLFLILVSCYSNAQVLEKDFSSLREETTTKKIFFKENISGITQQIIFLGEITDKVNGETYKVFVSFIDFADKGVNDLVFMSEGCQIIYRLNLPSDAPFKISYNELYFKNKNVIKKMKINNGFKDLFCTPFECFEKK